MNLPNRTNCESRIDNCELYLAWVNPQFEIRNPQSLV